jgi:hypothetical protein
LLDAVGLFELERRLVGLARGRGPLRVAVAELCAALVRARAWERLGYARLGDYAGERLGVSARSVMDFAHVGGRLRGLCGLRAALVGGWLGWTKVRLVARVARPDDEARWIAFASRVSALELSRELRRVDQGSLEAGALEEETLSSCFQVACTPQVRGQWVWATSMARRMHGSLLHVSRCAELIAAEVMSALPVDVDEETEVAGSPLRSWPEAVAHAGSLVEVVKAGNAEPGNRCGDECSSAGSDRDPEIELPGELRELLRDLDREDPFELDRRLRIALALEQQLHARMGPLLELLMRHQVHRMLGFATREEYASERLGIDPSRARALLRIERAARANPVLERAYREGRLTSLQVEALVPLLLDGRLDRRADAWVDWAGGITLRRLRDDVERALVVRDVDPAEFARSGGLPPGTWDTDEGATGSEQGIGARTSEAMQTNAGTDIERAIGARVSRPAETCVVRFIGPAEIVRLFEAVLCSVRRRIERVTGQMPTRGQALEAMLDHVLEAWGANDERIARRHRVFARDGWRCVVPGCSSMRNLHDHHVVFRSQGGGDEPSNRTTLCAFHHVRGVHAGRVSIRGKAPGELRFALGLRADRAPMVEYRAGDRRVATG